MTSIRNCIDGDAASDATLTTDALLALLSGANVGLAVFDPGLDLTFANARYLALCGYSGIEARHGRNLRDLTRIGMLRAGFDPATIEQQIEAGLRRLRSAGGYSFSLRLPSGVAVYVHRQMLPDGGVSETVQEAFADRANPNADRLEFMAQAARTRLAHALESMADGFALFDADDKLVIYNRRYVESKPRVEDLIAPGVSYEELLRASVGRSGYDIGDMNATDYIEWRLDQHRSPDQAYDVQTGDGRWIRVRERRTEDGGVVGTRSDITELKRREAEILRVTDELAEKKVLFETALNNMIQGLCMFDAEQRLIVCNRRYLEMYGFSAEVVKPGTKLDDIMAYSVRLGNYTSADAARARAERPDHAKLRNRATLKQYLRDGRVIAVMHEPMPGGGSIATYQDITESDRRDQALQQHSSKVEASNRELQEFAYVASHDLQEPLRKIETFGQRLVSKYAADLPEGAQLCIGRMENATGRMRKLINDLLEYSRVTTKGKPFARTALAEVLEGVLSDLEVRIKETGAVIERDALPAIDADQLQMRQLFQNIVGNSLKFQPAGATPHVRINFRMIDGNFMTGVPDRCEIRIADNGIGFADKYKDQIFTIFQRLHGRNEYEGTGIGLSTCRKIVERHGGTIDAIGKEGCGATFVITLPVIQRTAAEQNGRSGEAGADAASEARNVP